MDQLQQINIDDPRVHSTMRDSADVRRLMADGCRLFWDVLDCKVRLIKPSDGKLHRVTVPNALQKERLVCDDRTIE